VTPALRVRDWKRGGSEAVDPSCLDNHRTSGALDEQKLDAATISPCRRGRRAICAASGKVLLGPVRGGGDHGAVDPRDERLAVLFEHARVLADALMPPRLAERLSANEWASIEQVLREGFEAGGFSHASNPATVGRAAHQLAAAARDARRLGETAR
jgi:hypothetical protein